MKAELEGIKTAGLQALKERLRPLTRWSRSGLNILDVGGS